MLAIPLMVLDLTRNPLLSGLSAAAANLGYRAALLVASLVNHTQRQRLMPRDLLGRVTSTVRVLFLAADPLG